MQTTDTVVCLTTVTSTSGNEEKGGGKDAIKVGSTARVHVRIRPGRSITLKLRMFSV